MTTTHRSLSLKRLALAALGIGLMIVAVRDYGHVAILISDLVAGLLVASIGFSLSGLRLRRWIAGPLGLWFVAAAFLPALHVGEGVASNNFIGGLAIALTGVVPPSPPRLPSFTLGQGG